MVIVQRKDCQVFRALSFIQCTMTDVSACADCYQPEAELPSWASFCFLDLSVLTRRYLAKNRVLFCITNHNLFTCRGHD
ncbi:hypothetical protein PgNI_05335 [Pyricularia grisea]|uniref:Uncharacterized protein n=1 Tax=Pyricularia grisea TaxID=148305 RepID=A0A6P8B7C8_PYRGI|nr:hypothetical protein PgNI_05335 [Pyricularia grisea]TLD11222.1 hypothetical protein PgNI_05335 [Pyricularia grisea]